MKGVYECKIIEQNEVAPDYIRTVLECPEIAREARAGQFVNVQVTRASDPLLRRPFSIHEVTPESGRFSLLYCVIGRGTQIMSIMRPGDFVSIVGPLGIGFDIGESPESEHVLIAGGCGAAPLLFLNDAICDKFGCDKVTVLTGGHTKEDLLCETEFRESGARVGVSTDDGSCGYHGFITELLQQHLANRAPNTKTRIYSCGPHDMMREVARISREAGVESCQVSLENNMACGIGVCMGCVQKIKGATPGDKSGREWRRTCVCKDGPVFNAEEIIWE
ncbi:MAG: dihydroorotate dehydrogenase electron transfer subunit [Armatimonadetes bacterium]|nr:dihydroorotate dehydrogenase electron transfer subunit [Armatimonadota bacterium]